MVPTPPGDRCSGPADLSLGGPLSRFSYLGPVSGQAGAVAGRRASERASERPPARRPSGAARRQRHPEPRPCHGHGRRLAFTSGLPATQRPPPTLGPPGRRARGRPARLRASHWAQGGRQPRPSLPAHLMTETGEATAAVALLLSRRERADVAREVPHPFRAGQECSSPWPSSAEDVLLRSMALTSEQTHWHPREK